MKADIPIQRGEAQLSVIKAWKEQKITKVINKTQKKLLEISGWEEKKTTKIESQLAKIQRKIDSKKMEKTEYLRSKKAAVHAKAQEQKAKVQTRRAQEILDAEEEAARFQAMGQIPKKSSLNCF
uniref:Remorin C-terminal domain-containing protein n=2 Tax=Noccaea caerulescens TaxID=107243 RepID=A0A1J3HP65_NOCCA